MNTPSRRPYTFDRVIRIVFIALFIIGCIYLINRLKGALLPFLVAWLIAYMIQPLVEFFQKKLRIRSRIVAIILSLLSITGALTALGFMFIPSIILEIDKLSQIVQQFLASNNNLEFLPLQIQEFIHTQIDFEHIATLLNREEWIELIKSTLSNTWTFITGSVNQIITIVSWFIVLLYIIFILLDYDKIYNGFKALVPNKYKPVTFEILHDIKTSMNRYFRGQALVAFIVGVLFSIGFLIIGLPLAIVLGMFIGLLNMVPYLQIVGVVPTTILCLLKASEYNENFWLLFLAAMGVFVVVQLIQDIFIVPRIMGKVTGLNPAIILLSLSIWGSLMGVIGMIIALPLTTLLISYYDKYILGQKMIDENEVQKKRASQTTDNKDNIDI